MKVLVIGSGAKEHALVWKLVQSSRVEQVFCAPGNPGIADIATCVDIRPDNIQELCEFAIENAVDLTVVSTERPLSLGICDLFRANNMQIFGPDKAAVMVCSSKSYAKRYMYKNKIPTPAFGVFDKETAAIEYVKKAKLPVVIKYDTHINGEGSFICYTYEQARRVIEKCFSNLTKTIVIEDFIYGKEFTFPVVTDGYNAVPLVSSVPYKKSLEGDGGANTPGVGAIAPALFVDQELEGKIAQQVVFPLLDSLSNEGTPYTGILSVDLIVDDKGDLNVIEFNSFLGDPDAQTILPLLEDDLFEIMYSTSIGALGDDYEYFNISDECAASIVLLSGNYPGNYKTGYVIEGLDEVIDDDLIVFHGETKKNIFGEILTNGGRVLTLTTTASTLNRAYERVYDSVDLISFQDLRYRKDIAKAFIGENNLLL